MVSQKAGEEGRVIPFVQEVTADNQIEAAKFHNRIEPWGVEEGDRGESIEIGVSTEKFFRQRVAITGGDIGSPLLQHQTGKADSTAYLENVFA